jgi:hypothetical protein
MPKRQPPDSQRSTALPATSVMGGHGRTWAGKADYVVTQNVKDFPPKLRFAGTTIVTAEAFICLLEQN